MKIILLSPPYLPEYMRNARCDFVSLSATQWYPVLLGYCGAYLEKKGHAVTLIDAPAHGYDHDMTFSMVKEGKPDLLVVYTGVMSEANDIAFADRLVDETGCKAVFVGPFASIDPANVLSRSSRVDLLVQGEFEHPIAEIADGAAYETIRNLIFKSDGNICTNEVRPNLTGQQLDDIPFVSQFFSKQLDLKKYKTPSEYYPYMDILSGRGCKWGHCTYCLWVHTHIKGSQYNVRSVANVIDEFRYIRREMPEVKSVMIQDDTFTEERAADISEGLLAAGIKLPWSCYARANMGGDVLRLMKKAGCRNLHVGYESASQTVLNRIKKGVSVEQMIKFTEDAKRAGLRIHGDFAFGFPGETKEDALKTVDLAKRLKPHTAQFQLMIPFKGTPYYMDMAENGWLNDEGQPDMPGFSNDEIRQVAKKAYRSFYFSFDYILQSIAHPYDHFFGKLKTIQRAIPAMFWKKWNV